MSLQEIREIDVALFDKYEQVAKEFMAYLAGLSGDHYDPTKGDVSQRVNKARGMATALVALLASLHAYHPTFPPEGSAPPAINPNPTPPVLTQQPSV